MGKAKKRIVTACVTHGRDSDAQFRWIGKGVAVNPSKGKHDRHHGGCPICKAEANRAAASESLPHGA